LCKQLSVLRSVDFNWFKYHDNKDFAESMSLRMDDLGKMVLNPDVHRTYEVLMEKCSMVCSVFQAGKLTCQARKAKSTRCEGFNVDVPIACPTDALVFWGHE